VINWMNSGTYNIINKINDKRYIGSSINIHRRLSKHRLLLRQGKHFNKHLQSSFNKYGEDNFEFKPLIYCEPKDIVYMESLYITLFFTKDNSKGYNINDPDRHSKRSPSTIQLMRESTLRMHREGIASKVACFKKGNSPWNGGKSGYKLNISKETISKRNKSISLAKSKKVNQLDDNGNILKTFSSIREAGKYMCSLNNSYGKTNNISLCLIGKRKHAFSYRWEYAR